MPCNRGGALSALGEGQMLDVDVADLAMAELVNDAPCMWHGLGRFMPGSGQWARRKKSIQHVAEKESLPTETMRHSEMNCCFWFRLGGIL